MLLACFTVVVTASQYVGTPIHCWSPAYFTDSHTAFTDSVCWVTNTYYLPALPVVAPGQGPGYRQQQDLQEQVPGQTGAVKRHIGYYQWVPLLLVAQVRVIYVGNYCMSK